MTHYLAILVPTELGEWRVLFPDVPECEARGPNVEDARFAAVHELTRHIQVNDAIAPQPRDLSAIEHDQEWLSRHGVDLSKVVVTMIPLGG